MPLARAPMPFVTVAQEKRDFKIFVILITAWSRVQVLDGPPQSTKVSAFVFLFCSFVQFLAHLVANLITPPIVDLRVDRKGRAGLRVSGFYQLASISFFPDFHCP